MADTQNPNAEAVKQALEAGQAARAQSAAEFAERTKGKPTPTQEENDRAKLGEHVLEKEPDGADLDEGGMPVESRQRHLQAKQGSGGSYQTRQMSGSTQQTSTQSPTSRPATPPPKSSS